MYQLLTTLRITLLAFCFSCLMTDVAAQQQNLLSDLKAGSESSDPNNFTAFNGKMYFLANGTLFQSTGTGSSTSVVAAGIPSDQTLSGGPLLYNNNLYLITKGNSGYKLWSSTGGTATFIEDFSVIGAPSGVSAFNVQEGFLYISLGADRGQSGGASVAFRHNGKPGSKVELGESNAGSGNQFGSTQQKTNFYFGTSAVYGLSNKEVVKFGGNSVTSTYTTTVEVTYPAQKTAATYSYTTINPSKVIKGLDVLSDQFYFTIGDSLFKLGTIGVRGLIKTGVPSPTNALRVGTSIYFIATNGEIWRTDGSAQGTVKVAAGTIASGYTSDKLIDNAGTLYVSAKKNQGGEGQLYRLVGANLNPVYNPSNNDEIVAIKANENGTLYFVVGAACKPEVLWKLTNSSNATSVGNLNFDTSCSNPITASKIGFLNNLAFYENFAANSGREPWTLRLDYVTPQSCTGNVISNFSFENDLNGFNNWGNASITNDTRSGAKAVSIAANTSGGLGTTATNISIAPGNKVTFSFWAKISNTATYADAGVIFYDAAQKHITTNKLTNFTASYKNYTINAVAPTNAKYMAVYAWKANGTGVLTVDDICLIKVTAASLRGNETENQSIFDFRVQADKGLPMLRWFTDDAWRTKAFHIERGDDKGNFHEISMLDVQTYNADLKMFSLIDENPSETEQHYRIVSEYIDFTPNQTSDVIKYPFVNAKTVFFVFPNPVREELNVNLRPFAKQNISMQIFDANGRLVSSQKMDNVSEDIYTLDIQAFVPGQYWIQILNNEGKATQQKFVIID
jgi:hypothetical protein